MSPTGRFANGDVYEGTFKNDQFDGSGKFVWANGDVFEGLFRRASAAPQTTAKRAPAP